MWIQSLLRHLLTLLLAALLGGLLGGTLMRVATGFGVDERQLDTRLNEQSLQVLRHSRANERNILRFYAQYLRGIIQDRKSTRLNSSHVAISYAVFCLKKKKN